MNTAHTLHSACRAVACAITLAATAPGVLAQPAQHASGSHSNMDMKAMMKEGNDKMMSMQMTGDPDVDFALMMRMHHQGAIEMAQMQLQTGKDPEMRKMAQKIIADQKKEIAQFDKFLQKRGKEPKK